MAVNPLSPRAQPRGRGGFTLPYIPSNHGINVIYPTRLANRSRMRGTTGAAIKSRVATINLVHATNEMRPKCCGIFDYPVSYANSRLPFEDWKESLQRRSKYCSSEFLWTLCRALKRTHDLFSCLRQ